MDCTPEVRSVELNPGDNAIVLATDGLWDVLSDVAVVDLLGQVPPAAVKCPPHIVSPLLTLQSTFQGRVTICKW